MIDALFYTLAAMLVIGGIHLFYIGFIATVDSRPLSRVRRAR